MFWKAEYGLGYQGPVVSHVLDLLAPEPSTIIKGETGVEGCSIGSLKGKILSKQQQQQQKNPKNKKTEKSKNHPTQLLPLHLFIPSQRPNFRLSYWLGTPQRTSD